MSSTAGFNDPPGGNPIATTEYTARGFAKLLKKTDGSKTYFTVLEMNAEGQPTRFTHGNGVVTRQTYAVKNGNLLTQAAGTSSDAVLNYTYTYDVIGNLKTRENPHNTARPQEAFCYDGLNRLTHHTAGLNTDCSGTGIKFWSYDGHGNIASTTDALSNLHLYNYAVTVGSGANSRSLAHAVGTFQNFDWGNGNIASATFVYDLNGNMVNDADRYLSYSSFNLPLTMCTANAAGNGCKTGNSSRRVDFAYDAEHQRIWQKNNTVDATGGTSNSQTVYLNPGNGAGLSYERECQPDCDAPSPNRTRHRHYLTLGSMVVAAEIIDSAAGGSGTQYWHKDHLGSVAAVTTDAAPNAPCERAAYEAFGQRQGIQSGTNLGNCNIAGSNPVPATDRGFTQHEHIEELNLIHMNGRVFDPTLGRFMQADPHIQYPDHTQAYNRYAYLLNNPLNATDPTGFFRFKDLVRTAVAFGIGWVTGGLVSEWITTSLWSSAASCTVSGITIGNVLGGAAGGLVTGAINTGNIEGAMQGALSGGLFGFAGSVGMPNDPARYAAHALAGCVSGAASGGDCGASAIVAVGGKFVSNSTEQMHPVAQMAATVTAGGTISMLNGGSFSNGARTAAYGYLYNAVFVPLLIQGAVTAVRVAATRLATSPTVIEATVVAAEIGSGTAASGAGGIAAAGAAASMAAKGGGELTRVGRWMSEIEFKQMSATGRVVEGAGGRTSVISPPNPLSFNPPPSSTIYAEFNVPSSVLRQGGKVDWAIIPGPNIQTQIFGPAPTQMPPATCIVCVMGN